jgi:hypothetical protein
MTYSHAEVNRPIPAVLSSCLKGYDKDYQR